MKILVTGADGFIGSHLVEELLKNGHEVRALAQYNSFNYWGWLESIRTHKNLEVKPGDVRDPFQVDQLVEGMDAVMHLAALIAIPYSYEAPQSYIETNITGTINVCKAALRYKVKKVIHTSTSEVYGTAQYVPIDEKHPLQPQSPYSASKIAADAMAESFYNSFNLPLTIARPFNTYGPRQSARAVIPTIITQIAAGKKVIKLGDLSPTRDFNYVKDTCQGFLALLNSEKVIGQTINIGSNTEITILETVNLIKKLMRSEVQFVTDRERIRPDKSEVLRLRCDNTKLVNLTGFKSQFDLEKGLQETINWFCDNKNLSMYKTDIYNR
jgi:NAD dependent epimerase/dehydratase